MIINNISSFKTGNQSQQAQNIGFQGKIIDAHGHLGHWTIDNDKFEKNDLLDLIEKPFRPVINGKPAKEEDRVVGTMVSNLDCIDFTPKKDEQGKIEFKPENSTPRRTEYDGNIDLLKISRENPIIKPLAVCQPRYGSANNIDKLLQDNPNEFFGLKFHPEWHKLEANSKKYDEYMRVAKKYNMPCLFHCGGKDSPFSSPRLIYELAQKHPDVPVILAHLGAGGEEHHNEAINVLKESIQKGNATLYADISWVDCKETNKKSIIKAIKEVGADRLLFGTDAPLGEFGSKDKNKKIPGFFQTTVSEIKTAITNEFGDKAEKIIDKVFYKNAEELFFTKNWAKKPPETVKEAASSAKKSNNKLIAAGAFITAGVVAFGAYLYNKKNKSQENLPKNNIALN